MTNRAEPGGKTKNLKMDRFLIAENPLSDNGNLAIIHTIDPMAIIEAREGYFKSQEGALYKHYTYINSDGIPEEWTLRVHHLYTQEFDSERHHAIVVKLLDRAWHWYAAYMAWEDERIDN